VVLLEPVRLDFLPESHGTPPQVTPFVVPSAGEQRSGILPSLVPVANTPDTSPFRRPAASTEGALLEALEDRTTPTVVNLTSAGSSGSILGAVFVQGTSGAGGTGVIQSFVRIENNPTEQGYNTSSRPVQFEENTSPNFTRSFQLGEVAEVGLNGIPYYEFVLDVNQLNINPGGADTGNALLSLDQLRLYVSPTDIDTASNNFANGHNSATGTLGGLSPSYDMNPDLSPTNFVALNGNLAAGSGKPSMTLFVPVSALGTDPSSFIYLYSQFGGHTYTSDQGNTGGLANDGFEEWANTTVENPTITTQAGPAVVLGSGAPLNDTATLAGDKPTGTVTFTLTGPGGGVAYTDVVTVSGNGTYSTATQGNNAGRLRADRGGHLPVGRRLQRRPQQSPGRQRTRR
jgi:hypothetical protein